MYIYTHYIVDFLLILVNEWSMNPLSQAMDIVVAL